MHLGLGLGLTRLGGGGAASPYLGLTGDFDYFIDAVNGNDINAGTSEGAAWKTLSKITPSLLTAGATTRILVKRGGYASADDAVEVIEDAKTDAVLEIAFEPGCIMDGTAANAIGATNGFEFSGNVDWSTVVYGNGLIVRNYSEGTALSPNGFGNRDTHTLTVYDAYCTNCDDGFSCHENATMTLWDCSATGAEKAAFSHVDSAVCAHYRCYFEAASSTVPIGHTGGGGSLLLQDCVLNPTVANGRVTFRSLDTVTRCQIGNLTTKAAIAGTGSTITDCYLNAYADGHYPHTYRRCYGKFSTRIRTPGGIDMQDCVIVGPATGSLAVIYSDSSLGSPVAMTFSNNVVATASFMNINATNAGYLLAGSATFDGNSLWSGAAYDADLDPSLVSNTITTDPQLGAANTLVQADYESAAGLAGFETATTPARPATIPRGLFGPQIVTNGYFPSDVSGWDDYNGDGGVTWQATKRMRVETLTGQSNSRATQELTTEAGATYYIDVSCYNGTGFIQIKVGTASGGNAILTESVYATEEYSGEFVAPGTSTWVTVQNNNSTLNSYVEADNVLIRKVLN